MSVAVHELVAGLVAQQLPHGRLVVVDALDHVGPLTDPGAGAAIIREAIDESGWDPPAP